MATHRLRAGLIGAALMASTVAIAIYVVPAAEAPFERKEVGCVLPDPRYTVTQACGGHAAPFLTHEHRDAAGPVTRFELFPGGEWRFTVIATGDMMNGCADPTTLGELRALATAAKWQRQPSSTACDAIPAGTEAWLIDGVEKLAYNLCDAEQPDPQTAKLIERVLVVEGPVTPGAIQRGDCPKAALACYEWLGSTPYGTPPESKFVIEDSGAWQLTQRDVQSDAITLHETGVLAAVEVATLRTSIEHASWKLVEEPECWSETGVGTVAVHGHSITYGPCSNRRPDRSTQTAIDQLFAIYRSALRSNPHI